MTGSETTTENLFRGCKLWNNNTQFLGTVIKKFSSSVEFSSIKTTVYEQVSNHGILVIYSLRMVGQLSGFLTLIFPDCWSWNAWWRF